MWSMRYWHMLWGFGLPTAWFTNMVVAWIIAGRPLRDQTLWNVGCLWCCKLTYVRANILFLAAEIQLRTYINQLGAMDDLDDSCLIRQIDVILTMPLHHEICFIYIDQTSMISVTDDSINNKIVVDKIMAWPRTGDKPLPNDNGQVFHYIMRQWIRTNRVLVVSHYDIPLF